MKAVSPLRSAAGWAAAHNKTVGKDWDGNSASYVTGNAVTEAQVRVICEAIRDYGLITHDYSGTVQLTTASADGVGTPYSPDPAGSKEWGKLPYFLPWAAMVQVDLGHPTSDSVGAPANYADTILPAVPTVTAVTVSGTTVTAAVAAGRGGGTAVSYELVAA